MVLDSVASWARHRGGPRQSATLTLRIPAASSTTPSRLHAIAGKLVAEATREEDVTSSVVDLQARITNLQASEAQYRALLEEHADKIDDILSRSSPGWTTCVARSSSSSAQLKQLSGLADLSTLTVTLTPHDAPVQDTAASWDGGQDAGRGALAALVGMGQSLATIGIWLAVVGLPLLILVAIVALLGPPARLPRLPRPRQGGPLRLAARR